MKYLKNFFGKYAIPSLKIAAIFSILIFNVYAKTVEINKIDEDEISSLKTFFNDLDIVNLNEESFINYFSKQFNIKPFILDSDLAIAGVKINDSNYIFLKTTNDLYFNGLKEEDNKDNVKIFSEKYFEKYLLANKSVFNKLKNNKKFLSFWISKLNNSENNDLKSLQAYIFQIKKPEKNCTLAAVVGEDRFFPDVTEKENELYFLNLPVLYFTELPNISHVFFCYIDDKDELNYLTLLIDEYWPDQKQQTIFNNALKVKLKAIHRAKFNKNTFFRDLKKSLGKLSQKYDFSNIEDQYFDLLIETIQTFLLSNNISSFTELRKSDEDFKQELADRFFTAKTTAFFRDWRDMIFLKDWLSDLDERADKEGRAIKIKVYGCSTGQEVLSYAFELLEQGIENFKILASDIDSKVLNEAKNMRYKKEKFLTLPTNSKNKIIQNYFEEDSFGNLKIRFEKFFNDRIHFMIQDITLPISQDIPEGFEGPYDIVSVKNILLYLDETSRKAAIENIKKIINNLGIIILKDKNNKASNFLNKEYIDFIGINDFMIIKEPLEPNTESLKHVLNLFQQNMPSQLIKFFYEYAVTHKNKEIADELMIKAIKAHPDDLFALETLYMMYKNERKYEMAYETLKKICYISPFKFINLYSQLKEEFFKISDNSINKCIDLLSLFIKDNYSGKTFQTIIQEINNILSVTDKIETFLVVTEILSLRDSARFAKASPSKDGKWIQLALQLIDEYLLKQFSEEIFEHKIQILNNLFYNFPGNKSYENINYLKNLFDEIVLLPSEKFSILTKIAIGKLSILFADLLNESYEKSKIYHQAIKYCALNNKELNLLSDKEYGDYYTVLYKAYSKLAFMRNSNFTEAEINSYLSNALRTLEEALFVKTVYGYEEIKLKNNILKRLEKK